MVTLTGTTALLRALPLCAILCLPTSVRAAENACDISVLQNIPTRAADAPTGSEFARQVETVSEARREAAIEAELDAGNLPSFLRRLAPVTLIGGTPTVHVTTCVLPDYLAIGSDDDYLLVPMRLATALRIGARYGFILPTAKLVDAIYAQSTVHLVPQPLPASDTMRSTAYYRRHTAMIVEQLAALRRFAGVLLAGHKKDLVLTNRLWHALDRVAIYGWHKPDDRPIQTLSTVHGARYADYSHGARLVSTRVDVDGEPRSIYGVLADPNLAPVLNNEGAIVRPRELVATLSVPPPEATADATR